MTAFLGNQKTFGEVINIGTGVEVTISEVVKLIAEISGIPLEISIDEQRIRPEKSEVERLCASNAKAKEILNWSPSYSLIQGLEATYHWLKENAEKYNLSGSKYII